MIFFFKFQNPSPREEKRKEWNGSIKERKIYQWEKKIRPSFFTQLSLLHTQLAASRIQLYTPGLLVGGGCVMIKKDFEIFFQNRWYFKSYSFFVVVVIPSYYMREWLINRNIHISIRIRRVYILNKRSLQNKTYVLYIGAHIIWYVRVFFTNRFKMKQWGWLGRAHGTNCVRHVTRLENPSPIYFLPLQDWHLYGVDLFYIISHKKNLFLLPSYMYTLHYII